jgi:hypothetical protein
MAHPGYVSSQQNRYDFLDRNFYRFWIALEIFGCQE